MTKNHETSVAINFNKFMHRHATGIGATFHDFSLDGQDRDVGADYVLSGDLHFALVEFKYQECDLSSESRKPRRRKLCVGLQKSPAVLPLHDRCHFIAWSEAETGNLLLNIYRKEICNRTVFTGSELEASKPDIAGRTVASEFASEFFEQARTRSLGLLDFDRYVKWLLGTSESTSSTLELLAHDPTDKEFVLVRFSNLQETHDWLLKHTPSLRPPPPKRRRGLGR